MASAAQPPQEQGDPSAENARAHLAQLAHRCQQGDEQAFAQLQARVMPAMHRFFRDRVRAGSDGALIDDLAQRSCMALWRSLRDGRYDPSRSAITTFAYAVTSKIWLQHLRASGRADAALDRYTRLIVRAAPSDGDATTDAQHASLHASLLDTLRRVLAQPQEANAAGLTDDEAWLLRSWAGGLSDRDLAARLGIAASNVNVRKQRAYAKLRRYLSQQGFGPGSEDESAGPALPSSPA